MRKPWQGLFLIAALGISVVALLPKPPLGAEGGWDKLNHLLAFVTISLLARPAWSSTGRGILVVWLLAWGGWIELAQSLTATRQAEWGDLLADALGVAIGLGLGALVDAWRRRTDPRSRVQV